MFLASFAYRILASYIQTEGVRKLLQELDPHKATGPDNIPANLLKLAARKLLHYLFLYLQPLLYKANYPMTGSLLI